MERYFWNGEFGWEVVACYPAMCGMGEDVLLETFPTSHWMYCGLPLRLTSNGCERRANMLGGAREGRLSVNRKQIRSYRPILADTPSPRQDIVALHARQMSAATFVGKWKEASRKAVLNWDHGCDPLVGWLSSQGMRVCSVGTTSEAEHVPGTEDWRGTDLEHLKLLKAARLLVGPASGTTVLAMWLKTPVLTWGCMDGRLFGGPARGYRWNPFETPHYHPWADGFDISNSSQYFQAACKPPVERLMAVTKYALDGGIPVNPY